MRHKVQLCSPHGLLQHILPALVVHALVSRVWPEAFPDCMQRSRGVQSMGWLPDLCVRHVRSLNAVQEASRAEACFVCKCANPFVRSQKLVSPKCGLRRCHRTERSKCKLEHQKHPSSLFCGFKFLTAQQIAVCRQEAPAKKRTEETCAAQISPQFQKRAT